MDRPTLHPLAVELAESERLGAFADDLIGARARVSEAGLPLLLAALHLRAGRALVALLPEDADARDAAEAAAWYLGEEQVALLPSRGVRWDSGLEPPPHLVGERARALDVLAARRARLRLRGRARGAATASRPAPRADRARRGRGAAASRVSPSSLRSPVTSASSGSRSADSSPSAAGSSTSSRPRAASRSGSSSSATRSRRSAPSRRSRSAPSARSSARPSIPRRSAAWISSSRPSWTRAKHPESPTTWCRCSTALPTSSSSRRRSRASGRRSTSTRSPLEGAAQLDPFPRGQPHAFEAQRPAVAARGLAEAEHELASFVRAGQRVVVAFPHRGDGLRTAALLRRLEVEWLEEGGELAGRGGPLLHGLAGPARVRLARPRARPAPGHADLPQACAERRRPPRPRAPVLRRSPHRRLRRPRGPRGREAARLRDEGGRRRHARLPLPRLPRRGPAVRPARADREGLALHRRRREGARAVEARRQGLAAAEEPRARVRSGARRRADRALRTPPDHARRRATTSPATGSSGWRPSSPTARPRTSSARSRR